jgi:hypothetical protein
MRVDDVPGLDFPELYSTPVTEDARQYVFVGVKDDVLRVRRGNLWIFRKSSTKCFYHDELVFSKPPDPVALLSFIDVLMHTVRNGS